jgi:hypothetical protein
LQQRNSQGDVTFNTFSIVGSGPYTKVADLEVADFDLDGNLDIVVAIETTGFTVNDECLSDGDNSAALMILYSPSNTADSLAWHPLQFDLSAHWDCSLTEDDNGTLVERTCQVNYRDGDDTGYPSVDVADVDNDGDPDVVAAFNGSVPTPTANPKRVYLHRNPGTRGGQEDNAGVTRYDMDFDGEDDACEVTSTTGWVETVIYSNVNNFSDLELQDMDFDGDVDVVVSAPEQQTFRLVWLENFQDQTGGFFDTIFDPLDGEWYAHPLGENLSGLNKFAFIDFNEDIQDDLVIFSEGGGSVHWFRSPLDPKNQFYPWEVYDVVHTDLTPTAVGGGDLDGDGIPEVVVGVGPEIQVYSAEDGDVFGTWVKTTVHSDSDASTVIRSIIVSDMDDDGALDIVGTLDRDTTVEDGLFWFRNLGN